MIVLAPVTDDTYVSMQYAETPPPLVENGK